MTLVCPTVKETDEADKGALFVVTISKMNEKGRISYKLHYAFSRSGRARHLCCRPQPERLCRKTGARAGEKNGLDALDILTSATEARAPVLEKINGFLSLFAESASESERKLTLAMEPPIACYVRLDMI